MYGDLTAEGGSLVASTSQPYPLTLRLPHPTPEVRGAASPEVTVPSEPACFQQKLLAIPSNSLYRSR